MLEIQVADQAFKDENDLDENSILKMPTYLSNYASYAPPTFDKNIE